jgi:hypothetical protein
MAKFVACMRTGLGSKPSEPVQVNLDQILYLSLHNGGSRIHFSDGSEIEVDEAPDTLAADACANSSA